jgi:hypothetical protein
MEPPPDERGGRSDPRASRMRVASHTIALDLQALSAGGSETRRQRAKLAGAPCMESGGASRELRRLRTRNGISDRAIHRRAARARAQTSSPGMRARLSRQRRVGEALEGNQHRLRRGRHLYGVRARSCSLRRRRALRTSPHRQADDVAASAVWDQDGPRRACAAEPGARAAGLGEEPPAVVGSLAAGRPRAAAVETHPPADTGWRCPIRPPPGGGLDAARSAGAAARNGRCRSRPPGSGVG